MTSIFPHSSPEQWKDKVIEELKGQPFEDLIGKSQDGLELLPLYTSKDRKGLHGMHAQQAWQCRQDFWGKKEAPLNALILEALGASVSSIGLDDREGNELAALLKEVQLDVISLHLKTEEPERSLSDLKAIIEKQKIPLENIHGSLDHDPIGEAIERGFWKNTPDADMDAALNSAKEWPSSFGIITVRMDRFHLAGATSGKELLYGLASAKCYLDRAKELGLDLDRIAAGISFHLAVDTDFIESISKCMAFRVLWANLLNAYGVKNKTCHLSARTSGWSMAPVDLDTNLLRTSSMAFSAIAGGCDEVIIAPHDGNCDAFSMRMARNIQHLLRHESYMDKFQNPAEGAYLFEHLAGELADTVWTALKLIEEGKGFLSLFEEGKIQADMKASAEVKAKEILSAQRTWLGVNLYAAKDEQKLTDIHWTETKESDFPALSFPIFQLS